MTRYRSGQSYGHGITVIFGDCYRVHWTLDRYVSGSRLRFPTRYTRDTDKAGAERFAKRWGCAMPESNS